MNFDPRLTRRDPTGANRATGSRQRIDYIDCAKCGKVMREEKFVAHMQAKHPAR